MLRMVTNKSTRSYMWSKHELIYFMKKYSYKSAKVQKVEIETRLSLTGMNI